MSPVETVYLVDLRPISEPKISTSHSIFGLELTCHAKVGSSRVDSQRLFESIESSIKLDSVVNIVYTFLKGYIRKAMQFEKRAKLITNINLSFCN